VVEAVMIWNTSKPVWISEVGVSTFGAEEVQQFGLNRTAELLTGHTDRIHWYSLYDLPRAWPATTRHRKADHRHRASAGGVEAIGRVIADLARDVRAAILVVLTEPDR